MTDPSTPAAPSAWLGGLPYRLFRANQAVNRHLVAAIEDLGVTVTQLAITVHLDELGHMSASDLARLLGITPQSTTTALGHLEKLGWVTRIPHPVHRRVVWYEVTDAGLAAADEGRHRVARVNAELAAALPGAGQRELESALSAILATFGDDAPTGAMWPAPAWMRPAAE